MIVFRIRNIILPVFIIFTCTEVKAQVRTDYIVGLNISTMAMKDAGVRYQMRNRVGIHFGQIFNIRVSNNFDLQPGIMLTSKGSNYKIDSAEYSIAPVCLEIPLNVAFTAGWEKVKISVLGGAYFAYGVGGYKIDPNGNFRFLSYGSGELRDLKPLDFGLNYGVGINIKGRLLSVRYSRGFTNLSTSHNAGSETKNRVFSISVSAIFTGR
jgi:hypothetical protein